MKQLPGFVFCLLLLTAAACSEKTRKVVEEAYPDGNPKVVRIYSKENGGKGLQKEITYYPGRNRQMEGEFRNGQRHGRWVYYYENGNIWSEGSFKDGQNDGRRVTYYESGQIRYEGNYRSGTRSGRWKFYDEQGKLVKEVDYQDGNTDQPEADPHP